MYLSVSQSLAGSCSFHLIIVCVCVCVRERERERERERDFPGEVALLRSKAFL